MYIKISNAIRLGRGMGLLLLRQNDPKTGGFREPNWARTKSEWHPPLGEENKRACRGRQCSADLVAPKSLFMVWSGSSEQTWNVVSGPNKDQKTAPAVVGMDVGSLIIMMLNSPVCESTWKKPFKQGKCLHLKDQVSLIIRSNFSFCYLALWGHWGRSNPLDTQGAAYLESAAVLPAVVTQVPWGTCIPSSAGTWRGKREGFTLEVAQKWCLSLTTHLSEIITLHWSHETVGPKNTAHSVSGRKENQKYSRGSTRGHSECYWERKQIVILLSSLQEMEVEESSPWLLSGLIPYKGKLRAEWKELSSFILLNKGSEIQRWEILEGEKLSLLCVSKWLLQRGRERHLIVKTAGAAVRYP